MKKNLLSLLAALLFFAMAINCYAETEPNDNTSQANTLSVNGNGTGNVSGTDIQDWWKVTLTGDGVATFTLSTSNYTLGAYLKIYKSDGTTQITSIYLYDTDNSESTAQLPLTAGTYYAKVELYNGSDGYTITNAFTADVNLTESETNDDAASADILNPNTSQRGNIGYYTASNYDAADWWKIQVSQDGVLNFTLENDDNKAGAYLKIFKQDATTQIAGFFLYDIDDSESTGIIAVMAGTYYAKVEHYNGADGYTLSNTYTADANLTESETNDDAASADDLALNSTQRGNMGYWTASGYDQGDWWKIQIPKDGLMKFSVSNDDHKMGGYLRVYKQDATAEILNIFLYDTDDTKSTPDIPVFAGTYYVKIQHYNGADGYTLSNTFTASPDPDEAEPNDNAASASDLPIDLAQNGNMGYWNTSNYDVADWWKIIVSEDGALKLTITSTVQTLGAYIRLYASDASTQLTNEFIYSSESVKSTPNILVAAGTYYAKVEFYNGYGAYALTADFMRRPVAKFEMIQNISTFSFMDKSVDAETYAWDFGDGSKGIGTNPGHTYAEPGTYNVCLIVSSIAGSDTFCDYAVIKGIGSVVANKAGNTGDATIYVYGGGFTSQSVFFLRRSGFSDITGKSQLVDPGVLGTFFDLRGKETGQWDVVVETPGESPLTVPNGFTIEKGKAPDVWVDVVGRDRILKGRWQTYTINYGNNGNVDAAGTPLWLVISRHDDLEIEFVDFDVVLPKMAIDSGWQWLKDSFKIYFDVDSIHGQPFTARIYPLYIPIIPAGCTKNVHVRIKTTQDVRFMAWMNPPFFQSPISGNVKDCIGNAQKKAMTSLFAGVVNEAIPGVACATAILHATWNPFDYDIPGQSRMKFNSHLWNFGTGFLTCASDAFPIAKGFKLAIAITSYAADIWDGYTADKACRDGFAKKSEQDRNLRAVNSFDPNEITGPTGYAAQKYSLKHNEFPYTIFFENKADATAPAQEVFVTDTLDKNVYDLSTFSFTKLGFGSSFLYPLTGLKQFTGDIDMRPGKNIIVRVNAWLDENSGIIQWHFISLDPTTMELTEDPDGGFLNPNKNSPEGEGSVSFSVGLKSSLVHGDVIKNHASIVFDLNKPILTNEWKNTLDLVKPTSQVTSAVSEPGFKIKLDWSGSDQGAGVKSYTIYVSENDSAFKPAFSYTSETSAIFQGKNGVKYEFYSVAEDSVGNSEEKTAEDISITVGIDEHTISKDAFRIVPNPARDISSVQFALTHGAPVRLWVKDIQGRDIAVLANTYYAAGTHKVGFDTKNLESGIYFVSLETTNGFFTQKVVVAR